MRLKARLLLGVLKTWCIQRSGQVLQQFYRGISPENPFGSVKYHKAKEQYAQAAAVM
jgi:hypothetical protein